MQRVLLVLTALVSVTRALVPYPEQWETEASNVLRSIQSETFELVTNSTFLMDGARKRLPNWFRMPDDFIDYPVNPSGKELHLLTELHVKVESEDTELVQGVDESYKLTITATCCATIESKTVFGALRGMATFAQLLRYGWIDEQGQAIFTVPAPQTITDAPLYPYRGLLIDSSRHYLPMEVILTNLNAMEMNKLNVLHWHIVDSQSWPYQSERFPELSEMGAYRPELVYSADNVRKVVREAYYRGIRVVPEFDLPGHTRAIGESHPEFMAQCPHWHEPIDPTQDAVYEFIEELYKEIFSLFPSDMVHLGGDEVPLDCWKNDSSIQAYMKDHSIKDEVEMFELFEQKLLKIVDTRRPIVWQEVFDLGINVSQDTIVDAWKDWGDQAKYAMGNATEQGLDVILSSCWYLDHLNQDWKDYYKCDPRSKFNGTDEQMSHVLGGHASMWGERADASNFMSRVWPRASSAAERLWSGPNNVAESTIDDRMYDFRCHMVQRGIDAGPIGPGVCPKEPRFINNMMTDTKESTSWRMQLEEWKEWFWGTRIL